MRKFKKASPELIENIVRDSLRVVGLSEEIGSNKIALLTRLIFSGVSFYFFKNPNSIIDIGYIRAQKNPDKDELFAINIQRDDTVVNAETLWKYYTGELQASKKLKSLLSGFVNELLVYSQIQEMKINELTTKINSKKGKENVKDGIQKTKREL